MIESMVEWVVPHPLRVVGCGDVVSCVGDAGVCEVVREEDENRDRNDQASRKRRDRIPEKEKYTSCENDQKDDLEGVSQVIKLR